MDVWHQIRQTIALLLLPVFFGTVGYLLLGLSPLGALYQTVITVTTVGYTEVDGPFGTAERLFTVVFLVFGVACYLFAVGLVLDLVVERRMATKFAERRMSRTVRGLTDHTIICGLGRVGRVIADQYRDSGRPVVVVDRDPERFTQCGLPHLVGDATEDAVLQVAGVERARTLVAALDTDAANLYVTMSARAFNPTLFIVARAREEGAHAKLLQAGADRVVNPHHIGGARMAAFALQPNVAEFLDVAMRERNLQYRLEEMVVGPAAEVDGQSLRASHLRDRTGALVLALRRGDDLTSNPDPGIVLRAGDVIIAIGTSEQLERLAGMCVARPAAERA